MRGTTKIVLRLTPYEIQDAANEYEDYMVENDGVCGCGPLRSVVEELIRKGIIERHPNDQTRRQT